jgi:hypothetical protein
MLTKEYLLHLFDYDRERGVLIWKNPLGNNTKRWIGQQAGCIDGHRYLRVTINFKMHQVHKIIWFLEKGNWPKVVDHLNGERIDNRISNLEDSTTRRNAQNSYRHRKGKLVGASWNTKQKMWHSRCNINGKQKYFGYFSTELEAHERYLLALKDNNL